MKDEARIECELKGKQSGGKLDRYEIREFESGDETFKMCFGTISGDRRFSDGNVVRTSIVEEVHLEDGYLETLNTFYELGEPATEEDYPRITANHGVFAVGKPLTETAD